MGTRFGTMLDLGCGTGLAGAAFRPHVDWLVGVDLSPKMIEEARKKGLYDRLAVGDITPFLAEQPERSAHLVIAADVFAYIADCRRGLRRRRRACWPPAGCSASRWKRTTGEGAIVGAKMRYAHSADFVRGAIAQAGLTLIELTRASSRTENRVPVPGLLVLARR